MSLEPKSYHEKTAGRRLLWILGIGQAIAGVSFSLVGSPGGALLGVGLFLIAISVWRGRTPLIRLADDRLELRIALARAKIVALYADITGIHEDRKGVLLSRRGDLPPIRLPLHTIDAGEREECLGRLRQVCALS